MFDFLFKRTPKPFAASKLQAQTALPAAPDTTAAAQAARDAARAQAAALGEDESATVAFLLACEFADARLIAAQFIDSEDALQRVLKALRNTDRRVARLMQSRLDALHSERQSNQLAQRCIADAAALAAQAQLTSQQAAQLDRRWAGISGIAVPLQETFATVRATLADRLAQQVALQRAVIDMLANLQHMATSADKLSADDFVTACQRCEDLDVDIDRFGAATEAVNLPKNLMQQCRTAALEARAALDAVRQTHAKNAARAAQLQTWEATSLEALDAATLQREWRLASTTLVDDADLSARFSALLERVIASKPMPARMLAPTASTADMSPQRTATPASKATLALEHALAQALELGQLQQALEADRQLRVAANSVPESAAQKARLAGLRIRLNQLQGWARWGGKVSREELQKAADALPAQNLSVVALAKKIGNLRAQWKAMDRSAGPAQQASWHHFDAACTSAYAPVAAHHQVLAEARQKNSEAAIQQIAALEQTALQLDADAHPNWKNIAQLCQRAQQEWQRLGPTERTNKRGLDQRFQTALQRLLQPLAQIQSAEHQQREQLIATVMQLRADEHGALTTLRALQMQWQECAKSVLLDRRDEQALWLRFKAACDAVFAQRKEHASVDDRLRQENLRTREALCAALENIVVDSVDASTAILHEATTLWRAAGAVPRAAQEAIEKRHRQAIDRIKKQIDHAQQLQSRAQQQAVLDKLQLCQRLDGLLGRDLPAPIDQIDALTAEMNALRPTETALDAVLTHRFEQALQAHRTADQAYRQRLHANIEILHSELIRLEILLSLASPPEQARTRLKLQVEVLQSALRDGPRAQDNAARLTKLCALAVVVDASDASRIEQVVTRLLAVN